MRRLLEQHSHCRIDLKHNWNRIGCGAVKEKLYLTAYGDLMPCPFIQVSLGNVAAESVGAIRKRALKVPDFADYAPICLAAEDPEFQAKCSCYGRAPSELPVPYTAEDWFRPSPASR